MWYFGTESMVDLLRHLYKIVNFVFSILTLNILMAFFIYLFETMNLILWSIIHFCEHYETLKLCFQRQCLTSTLALYWPHKSVGEVLHERVDLDPVISDTSGPETRKQQLVCSSSVAADCVLGSKILSSICAMHHNHSWTLTPATCWIIVLISLCCIAATSAVRTHKRSQELSLSTYLLGKTFFKCRRITNVTVTVSRPIWVMEKILKYKNCQVCTRSNGQEKMKQLNVLNPNMSTSPIRSLVVWFWRGKSSRMDELCWHCKIYFA